MSILTGKTRARHAKKIKADFVRENRELHQRVNGLKEKLAATEEDRDRAREMASAQGTILAVAAKAKDGLTRVLLQVYDVDPAELMGGTYEPKKGSPEAKLYTLWCIGERVRALDEAVGPHGWVMEYRTLQAKLVYATALLEAVIANDEITGWLMMTDDQESGDHTRHLWDTARSVVHDVNHFIDANAAHLPAKEKQTLYRTLTRRIPKGGQHGGH